MTDQKWKQIRSWSQNDCHHFSSRRNQWEVM